MTLDLIPPTTLAAYLAAATLLVLAPGPGQALVVARSIEAGARAGMLTAAGLELGTLAHVVAASLGLSAILATSATAFNVVKYLGAAYLVVLGASMLLRARRQQPSTIARTSAPPTRAAALLAHATLTGVLNPKVALFFLAFLPQFVDPARGSAVVQFLLLGAILSVIGFAFDAVLAAVTARARRGIAASPRFAAWRDRLTGSVLIALGLKLALAERR